MLVSADGFIEGPGRELDWHKADDEPDRHFNEQLAAMGAFLTGRVTCKLMAGVWPALAPAKRGLYLAWQVSSGRAGHDVICRYPHVHPDPFTDGGHSGRRPTWRLKWTRRLAMGCCLAVLPQLTAWEARQGPCVPWPASTRALNEVGKEDLDFPLGGLRRVGSVHDVLLYFQRVVSADGAHRSADRVGGAC